MSGGRGDEVVAAAGQELHRVRLGREGAEADGEHAARGEYRHQHWGNLNFVSTSCESGPCSKLLS